MRLKIVFHEKVIMTIIRIYYYILSFENTLYTNFFSQSYVLCEKIAKLLNKACSREFLTDLLAANQ